MGFGLFLKNTWRIIPFSSPLSRVHLVINGLGGGFKDVLLSPLPGEMTQF